MQIRILGAHNCESRETKLTSLLIDGALALDAGALTSSLSFARQLKLKAVLLTHQHYDHIRDVPAIAMNALLHQTTLNLYSTREVYDALVSYLLNRKLYPEFLTKPEGNPTIRFTAAVPGESLTIDGYEVLPVALGHSAPAVGYQVTAPDGKALFYTGDCGPGLADCWRQIAPRLLIIEVTAPDQYQEFAREAGHLTPGLLEAELTSFRQLKGYLPQVVTIHMNPLQEKEIAAQIAGVARRLGSPIELSHEGMVIDL